MAIFYMNAQIIGRSAGRSATAAAAYRAGERIHDERTGLTHDYTRRRGEIETHIMAPEHAPEWAHDRSQLWNRAELAERRADAQVARELVVAFPRELNTAEQRELIRSYVHEQFVSRGMVADVAIHRNEGNPHAHILLTMRELGPEGFSARKNREWNRTENLERWREGWSRESNRALERAGREERIDHRSLRQQGIDRLPQVHLGPRAAALEERGIETARGEQNRAVAEHNRVVIDLERARAEREALLRERQVRDRIDDRVRHGWPLEPARAIADLERSQGGRELTERDISDRQSHLRGELDTTKEKIRAIEQEKSSLDLAQNHLSTLREAERDLRRHRRPWAVVRQWFDPMAQADRKHAERDLEWARDNVARSPIRTESDLAAQRERFAPRQAELPQLHSRLEGLIHGYNFLHTIVQAFQKDIRRQRERDEYERELLRQRERRSRSHERDDYDRGR